MVALKKEEEDWLNQHCKRQMENFKNKHKIDL
jgi:hypothetical protein